MTVRAGGEETIGMWHARPWRSPIALLLLFAATTSIAYLRNPVAMSDPTMFTEDGSWIASLYTRGALETYLHARPDYFVVANVLVLHLAKLIAEITGAGALEIPRIIAALSYLFYGFVAVLPAITLRGHLSVTGRILVALLIASIPVGVPQSSAEIWGRASNIGFAFSFIAVLSLIWRETLRQEGRRWTIVPDLLILLSCATNPIAVPLVGLYLVYCPFTKGLGAALREDGLLTVAVGLITISVIFGVVSTPRSPEEASTSLSAGGLVLSGLARPLLYPFLYPVYGRLDQGWTLVSAFILTAFLLVPLVWCRNRLPFGFLLLATALVTMTVAIQRPLLPLQLGGYGGTYPDRYFFAQNIMIMTSFVWASDVLRRRFAPSALAAIPQIAILLLYVFNISKILLPGQVACSAVGTSFAAQIEAASPIPGREHLLVVEICPPTWFIEFPGQRGEGGGLGP